MRKDETDDRLTTKLDEHKTSYFAERQAHVAGKN